jgi:CDP-glycerol glycerophosphotransferase (TagB/SpsB family)
MNDDATSLQTTTRYKVARWRKLILRAVYLLTVKYIWVVPFRAFLRILTYLVPRDPNLWAFGHSGGRRFADNSKGLFLEALAHKDINATWMTQSRDICRALRTEGLPVCRRRTLNGLWLGLRAGVYVFDMNQDDINYWTSRGAITVNLWHGIPLKKLERDVTISVNHIYDAFKGKLWALVATKLTSPWVLNGYDLIAVTSLHQKPIYARAFGVDPDQVKVLGQPRNDILLKPRSHALRGKDAFQLMLEEAAGAGHRVLLYMPTYRQYSAAWEKEQPSLPWGPEGHKRLSVELQKINAKMFIKPHPWDNAQWNELGSTGSIRVISGFVDVYDSLKNVDVLITDYSSIYFDFLLLDRPIIFYCFDLETYLARERGMYYQYEDVTPGAKARTLDELIEELGIALTDRTDKFRNMRHEVTSMFYTYIDGGSSLRTIREIRALQCHRGKLQGNQK